MSDKKITKHDLSPKQKQYFALKYLRDEFETIDYATNHSLTFSSSSFRLQYGIDKEKLSYIMKYLSENEVIKYSISRNGQNVSYYVTLLNKKALLNTCKKKYEEAKIKELFSNAELNNIKAESLYLTKKELLDTIQSELSKLEAPNATTQKSYDLLIAVLIRLLLNKDGQYSQSYYSQDNVVQEILTHFPKWRGLGKTTVDAHFSRANQQFYKSKEDNTE